MTQSRDTRSETASTWHAPAPRARSLAVRLYSWRGQPLSFWLSVLMAAPFIWATYHAPALLNIAPMLDKMAPLAEMRAVMQGQLGLSEIEAPFASLLLMLGAQFAESPGRIHLVSKMLAGLMVGVPLAFFAMGRLPVLHAALLVAGVVAFLTSPLSGVMDMGIAMLLALAVAFLAAAPKASGARAMIDGIFAGGLLYALWLLSSPMALSGFVLLSFCPFLSGDRGLARYLAVLLCFGVLSLIAELCAPGINMARAAAGDLILPNLSAIWSTPAGFGLNAVVVSAGMIVLAVLIFGGASSRAVWFSVATLMVLGFGAARLSGANPAPVFVVAILLACFCVRSPFYQGIFGQHDRASISLALLAAGLSVFWSLALIGNATRQFMMQHQLVAVSERAQYAQFGMVQPGGALFAKWVEQGRFSAREASAFLGPNMVDQMVMLQDAAGRVRAMSAQGVDVAILTAADTACLFSTARACHEDGTQAAAASNVIFVPRRHLEQASEDIKRSAEALLYTEFKLAEQTALWDIWVRRGTALPR